MTPYENLTLRDYLFYFVAGSMTRCLYRDGPQNWVAFGTYPTLVDPAGERVSIDSVDHSRTLEDITDAGYRFGMTNVINARGEEDRQGLLIIRPTDLFDSLEWVMFTPILGYLDVGGKLGLYQCSAPRRRNRAFDPTRIVGTSPIDVRVGGRDYATPSPEREWDAVVVATLKRLNAGFPVGVAEIDKESAGLPASEALSKLVEDALSGRARFSILRPTTALIHLPHQNKAALVESGTYLGDVVGGESGPRFSHAVGRKRTQFTGMVVEYVNQLLRRSS